MKATLEIEFGNKTCAAKPGKFCRFAWSKNFNTEFVCGLFDNERLFEDVPGGWLLRCKQCLEKWPAKKKKAKEN